MNNPLEIIYHRNLQSFNSSIIHYGDNKTGVGEGDDEVLSVDFANVDPNAFAMTVIINSFKGNSLVGIKNAFVRLFDQNKYIGVHEVNSSNPNAFIHELDYGVYDFKYRGFAYTWECLTDSVLYIVGINMKGDPDIGTAYYIGNNMVVTAAHCVDCFKSFTLHLSNHQEVSLREVWYAKGQDCQDYDLAVLITVEPLPVKPLKKEEPSVLDDVLVMGYPPLSGFDAFQAVETATVGAILKGSQKAITGQIVSKTSPYMSQLDHFS